jgi:hypothetical protein
MDSVPPVLRPVAVLLVLGLYAGVGAGLGWLVGRALSAFREEEWGPVGARWGAIIGAAGVGLVWVLAR